MPERGRYVVLMFVDRTPGNLEIEYEVIDRVGKEPSQVTSLTPEGTGHCKQLISAFLSL